MSEAADHIRVLRELLRNEKVCCERAIVETFYRVVSNQAWDSADMVNFLQSAKDISHQADFWLDHFIAFEVSQRED